MAYNPNARGTAFKAPARGIQTNFQNASGSTLLKAAVVSSNTSGQIVPIVVNDDASVSRFMGLVAVNTPNAATGGVMASGRLEDVTTSFAVGDALYVGADGALTNVKPDYGVSTFDVGYYVIFIGVVVKNEFNASLKDIQVMPQVIGQL